MRTSRLYVPMVGIPFIGVLLILQFGKGLHAAPAIHGDWRVRSLSIQGQAGGCLANLSGDSLYTIIIAQSGPEVSLDVRSADAGTWAHAMVYMDRHTARGTLRGPWSGCADSVSVNLRLVGDPITDSIFGVLADSACAACAELSFVATRRRPNP